MGREIKYIVLPIGGVFLAVVIVLILMLATYDRRTPDEFVRVWKNTVEKGDTKLYESLWDENARKRKKAHFNEARKPEVKAKPGPVKAPAAKVERGAPLDTELKLRQIIEDWRQAWEKKDVNRYIGKYADFAEIRRVTVVNGKEYPVKLTKEELRRRMRRLWRKYGRIEVNISTLQIKGDYATADVNFLQEYKAWIADNRKIAYQDFGTKQLKFVKDVKDNSWKIISENWKIYKKVPSYPKL